MNKRQRYTEIHQRYKQTRSKYTHMAEIDRNDVLILTKVAECKSCHHECHCDDGLHADEYGICTCDDCKHEEDYELEEKYNITA